MFLMLSEWVKTHPARAGALAGYFNQGATALSAILVVPVLMHLLSPENVGRWFAFQGFIGMANLVDFGLGFAISRQTAHCLGGGRPTEGTDFLNFGNGWEGVARLRDTSERLKRITLVLAAFVGVILFEVILPRTELFVDSDQTSLRALWYILLTSSIIVLSAGVELTLLNGAGKMYITLFATGCYFLTTGTAIIIAAYLWRSLTSMATTVLIVSCVYRALIAIVLRKSCPDLHQYRNSNSRNQDLLVPLVKVAFPVGIVNIGAFLMGTIQAPMLGALLGPSIVAPFYLAQKIGQALNRLASQFLRPQLPFFTQRLAASDVTTAKHLMRRGILWSCIWALLANTIFVSASPLYFLLVSKDTPSVNLPTLILMAVDYSILYSAVSFGVFVLAAGKNPFVFVTLLAGALNLTLILFLTPRFGVVSIPLSSLFSGAVSTYWYNIWEGRKLFRQLSSQRKATSMNFPSDF